MEEERDKQAFMELQQKAFDQSVTLKTVGAQTQKLKVVQQRCALTASQINGLSEDTPMYKTVGKAYFLTPKEELMKTLEEQIIQAKGDLSKQHQLKQHAEKALKQAETEIRELIQNSPSLASKLASSLTK